MLHVMSWWTPHSSSSMDVSIRSIHRCDTLRFRTFQLRSVVAHIAWLQLITAAYHSQVRGSGLQPLNNLKTRVSHRTCKRRFTWPCAPRGPCIPGDMLLNYGPCCDVPRHTRSIWVTKPVRARSNIAWVQSYVGLESMPRHLVVSRV